MSDTRIAYRGALADDISPMHDFILRYGPNPWNYLPEDEVRAHLAMIRTGEVEAVIAEYDNAMAGFASFHITQDYSRYQPPARSDKPHGYVDEVVVHPEQSGKGIGAALMKAAALKLFQHLGLYEVYAIRHEENAGSAGMMRKAGFEIIDTYDDPARRPNGSRRTTVTRLVNS